MKKERRLKTEREITGKRTVRGARPAPGTRMRAAWDLRTIEICTAGDAILFPGRHRRRTTVSPGCCDWIDRFRPVCPTGMRVIPLPTAASRRTLIACLRYSTNRGIVYAVLTVIPCYTIQLLYRVILPVLYRHYYCTKNVPNINVKLKLVAI